MASPDQFAERMADIALGVEREADHLVRRVAVAAAQTVITATPVDTGRARSNWLASIDVSREGETREALAEGEAATGPALQEAEAIIATYDGARHKEVRLANSLPYIQRLNEGYSAQAPAGFVRLGLQAAVKAVEGARLVR